MPAEVIVLLKSARPPVAVGVSEESVSEAKLVGLRQSAEPQQRRTDQSDGARLNRVPDDPSQAGLVCLATEGGLPSLYNESLGTVSESYHYDRVQDRDKPAAARPKRPWEVTKLKPATTKSRA